MIDERIPSIKPCHMTSESQESVPPMSHSHLSKTDWGPVVWTSIAVIATVFSLFFLMGFFSAWLKGEGDWMALVMRGLKFSASGSLGVLCIGISAQSWKRLPVPAWVPSTASFAVGFFVMNGMGELLDGRYESILPKAGGGFLAGCLGGLGLYGMQKYGWGRPPTSAPGSTSSNQQLPESTQTSGESGVEGPS
ncbi:MAG: hypothetical protein KDA91_06365 [Planctomycetaceae bacterium]|nr:hypothetical protein [Planctomycetaceae bacterium]